MKIAFDHQIFGWQEYGGVSRYAYELAVGLVSTCSQEVAVISPLYVNRYLAEATSKLRIFGVQMPKLPRTGRIYRAINWFIAWPFVKYFHPDIVHETYYSSRTIAPKSAKVILTVYDMIHERFSNDFSLADPTSREKAIAVARADHVICISEQTRRDLIDLFGVNPAKTSVVYLGFTLTTHSELLQNHIQQTRPFLLYVGNRGGYKNFEQLLQVYATSSLLKNDFDLICFGGGELTSREKTLLQKLGISKDNVRHVSGNDQLLAEHYKSARAFIYPSLYEGFGIPPLEAMSFDCPVICSNVSSIPEVVGDAGEMFDPSDSESMRMAIERVIEDSALRETLIVRGRERIKLFSWERCAQETLNVYRQVLS